MTISDETTSAPSTAEQQTSDDSPEEAARPTAETPETVRYTVTARAIVQPNYTTIIREAVESWNRKPDGTELEFTYTTDADAADFHIILGGRVQDCNGDQIETEWYYCTLDNSTDRDTNVIVSGIYRQTDIKRIVQIATGQYIGYEAPAEELEIDTLSDRSPQYLDPWPTKSTVVVNLSVEVDGTREWAPLVRQSLDYWDAAEHEYGNYTENFVFRPDAEHADVTVSMIDDIDTCGFETGDFIGCADLYGRGVLADPVTDVQIEVGYTNETTVDILKHEFGHVYGRQHGQEPMPIMNASIVNATRIPKLNATERTNPFRENPIEVFVDYNSFDAPREDVRFQFEKAVDYYDTGSSPHVAEELNVTMTRNRSAAEIIINGGQIQLCEDTNGPGSCGTAYGMNEDSDHAFEYYTLQNITIQGIDTDALGWHAGYWMAFTVGSASDITEVPDPFRDADYQERRDWLR
ncbi:hypothetical protein DV733_12325 [Halapricum salinum]|uniref:Matrixin n=1 Tax=Halapricum salinum TaxID=1457250 RepID=A0A4D6HEG2_9EURY|nr:hypothetical protein DV733_12325 [Halapricum salinum]